MPSLGGSRRRHSKQPSLSKKAAPPPPINVLSTPSSGSTTAANTPRVDIYSSGPRMSKRPGLMSARPERPSTYADAKRTPGLVDRESVDVFAFMQKEDDDRVSDSPDEEPNDSSPQPLSSSSSSPKSPSPPSRLVDGSQKSPRYSDLEVRAIQDGVQRAWGRASLHSDSGISVRSHSPDQDSPIMEDKLPLDHDVPMMEESGGENDDMEPHGLLISPRCGGRTSDFAHRHWPSVDKNQSSGPEAYPTSIPQRVSPRPVSHDDAMPEMMHARPASSTMIPFIRPRQNSATAYPFPSSPRLAACPPPQSGYDLLASNISTKSDALLRPIYRKFEILNNRMLLYLQDEIAQMEEDLKDLDAAITMEDHNFGKRGPASRRSEAKLPSQLQWHRLDLLGRCFAKVEQYNRALTSYSNLTKSLSPASATDIDTYSQWIADHTPITDAESAFLSHPSDLLSIPTIPSHVSAPAASAPGVGNPFASICSTTLHESALSSSHSCPTFTATGAPIKRSCDSKKNDLFIPTLALLATLILFPFIPSVIARLAVSALVGLAALAAFEPEALTTWEGVRRWKTVVGLWLGVTGCLSLIVTG